MRKTGLLPAVLLLASSGLALNLHAQETRTTTPGTTTRTTETTTTTTRGGDADATTSRSGARLNTAAGDIQAFTGKITKKDKQFMLENKDLNANYKLDDATKADHYDGKNVK